MAFKFQLKNRSALIVLLGLVVLYVSFIGLKYSRARNDMGVAKDAILTQLRAMSVRRNLGTLAQSRVSKDAQSAWVRNTVADSNIKITSFECRGGLLGDFSFRVGYVSNGASPANPSVRYFSMRYSLLVGWRTQDLFPSTLGLRYHLSPWKLE